MKKILLLLFLALRVCNALDQDDTANKTAVFKNATNKAIDANKSSEDVINRLPPPVFSWTNQHSIHITFPNQVEDDLHLQAADPVGRILVSCLFNGVLEREIGGTAVVSGCVDHPVVSVAIYSVNLNGRMSFDWINNNATVEVSNPYLRINGTDPANEYFSEEDVEEERVKRGTLEYYDGEEEFVDLDYDGSSIPDPLPSDLILKVKLAFDSGLLEHMKGDEEAAKEYVIRVASLGRIHLLHASLGTRIHLQFVDEPVLVPGVALAIDRKSLTYVQSKKDKEAVPLICFVKTDDTDVLMGVAWPGRFGGACQPDKGAALLKHRNNINKAAITFAHEDGHLAGLFHDLDEDRRKLVAGSTCEGTGIMSSGAHRPLQFSVCSAKRLRKWFPRHGQCLVTAPSCVNNLQWSTPCSCGTGDFSVGCSSLHVFCSKIQLGEAPYQCLTRNDIVLASLTARKSAQDLDQKLMLLEKKMENNEKKMENAEKKMEDAEKRMEDAEKKMEDAEKKMEDAEKKMEDAEKKIDDTEKKMEDAEKKIEDTEKKMDDAEKKIDDAEKKIDDAEKKIEDTEKKVENLEKKSSYCGYRNPWTSDNSYITYSSILLGDNVKMAGAGLNKDTGRFTAGVSGTYQVHVSMRMYSNSGNYNQVYIRKNNVDIAESRMYSYVQTYSVSGEMGGRSMMLHLDLGDTVSLYAKYIYQLYYITFCISLE